MKPFFENNRNFNELLFELKEWEGTPHKHLTMVKGRGADCTLFIGGVWLSLSIVSKIEYDYYPRDWYMHEENRNSEFVLDSFMKHCREHLAEGFAVDTLAFNQNKGDNPQSYLKRGDIVTFNMFSDVGVESSHHAAVWVGDIDGKGNRMFHSIKHNGVIESQFGSYWSRKVTNIFRLMEKI